MAKSSNIIKSTGKCTKVNQMETLLELRTMLSATQSYLPHLDCNYFLKVSEIIRIKSLKIPSERIKFV